MNNEAAMTKSKANTLKTVYCPNCHLSTRANSDRCLHCGKAMLSLVTARGSAAAPAAGRERS